VLEPESPEPAAQCFKGGHRDTEPPLDGFARDGMTVLEGRPRYGGNQIIVIERFCNEPGTIGRRPRGGGGMSRGIEQVKLALGQHHEIVPGTNFMLNRDDAGGAIGPLILSIMPMVR